MNHGDLLPRRCAPAGEVSSELPSTITIAAPRGTVLKEKVLTLSARIFGFFARCILQLPFS